jgi:predicted Zn-dependent protease
MKNLLILLLSVLLFCSSNNNKSFGLEGLSKPESHSVTCSNHNIPKSSGTFSRGESITIYGVEDVPRERLYVAKRVLENFFGFTVNIDPRTAVINTRHFFNENREVLNAYDFVNCYEPNNRVLYITNKKMYSSESYVRGYTLSYGKVILVRNNEFMEKTIIHEVGHTYGLKHCENVNCVMGTYNDNYDTGDFCTKCKNIINFK